MSFCALLLTFSRCLFTNVCLLHLLGYRPSARTLQPSLSWVFLSIPGAPNVCLHVSFCTAGITLYVNTYPYFISWSIGHWPGRPSPLCPWFFFQSPGAPTVCLLVSFCTTGITLYVNTYAYYFSWGSFSPWTRSSWLLLGNPFATRFHKDLIFDGTCSEGFLQSEFFSHHRIVHYCILILPRLFLYTE